LTSDYRARRESNPQPSVPKTDAHNAQVLGNTGTYDNSKNAYTEKNTDSERIYTEFNRLSAVWDALPKNIQKAIIALAGV